MVMEFVNGLSNYFVNDYIRAFVVFVSLSVLFRITLFIIEKTILFFTKRTKTDLDDILVEKLSLPVTILSILFAINVSVKFLILEGGTNLIIENLIYSLEILVVVRIVYLIVNILIMTGLRRLSGKTKVKVNDTLFNMFSSLLNWGLFVIAALYIMNLWGVEVGPFLAGLGIAGLAVALALQPILSNIFSGAAVIMDGSVRVGDLVYLDSESIKGKIVKIGLRSTKIKTFDNEFIIVPNNKLAESSIQNVALPDPKVRVIVPFGVAYGSDIKKVKDVVRNEIKKIANISEDEDIFIRFLEMGNSSLDFKAYFYVTSFEHRIDALDEANTRIYNALAKAGIEIPFPQMDIHMKK